MLELKNVSFSVSEDGKHKELIHDLSLKVDKRKFVVVTGPNGGGKSTLAKLIMGVEQPTGGQILFDGEDITKLTRRCGQDCWRCAGKRRRPAGRRTMCGF